MKKINFSTDYCLMALNRHGLRFDFCQFAPRANVASKKLLIIHRDILIFPVFVSRERHAVRRPLEPVTEQPSKREHDPINFIFPDSEMEVLSNCIRPGPPTASIPIVN